MRVNQFNQPPRLFSKNNYSDSDTSTTGVIIERHIIRNLLIILIVGFILLLTPTASVGPSNQVQYRSFGGSNVLVNDEIFLGRKSPGSRSQK